MRFATVVEGLGRKERERSAVMFSCRGVGKMVSFVLKATREITLLPLRSEFTAASAFRDRNRHARTKHQAKWQLLKAPTGDIEVKLALSTAPCISRRLQKIACRWGGKGVFAICATYRPRSQSQLDVSAILHTSNHTLNDTVVERYGKCLRGQGPDILPSRALEHEPMVGDLERVHGDLLFRVLRRFIYF